MKYLSNMSPNFGHFRNFILFFKNENKLKINQNSY